MNFRISAAPAFLFTLHIVACAGSDIPTEQSDQSSADLTAMVRSSDPATCVGTPSTPAELKALLAANSGQPLQGPESVMWQSTWFRDRSGVWISAGPYAPGNLRLKAFVRSMGAGNAPEIVIFGSRGPALPAAFPVNPTGVVFGGYPQTGSPGGLNHQGVRWNYNNDGGQGGDLEVELRNRCLLVRLAEAPRGGIPTSATSFRATAVHF